MAVILLEEVSKLYGFGGATTIALDEISFKVEAGEFVAIMGPSGSGKSTLLHIIGLLDRPTNGVYKLNERSVERTRTSQRTRVRRRQIGFVFQSFNLIPDLTVIENVALPLAYRGMFRGRRLKKASAVLERVGLSDKEFYLPRQLSGGQAQRTAIARALVNDPDIIIADEPTGNLDSGSSRLVMELLRELHKNGTTIILVTHNPELTRYASRVVFMHDGSIISDELTHFGDVPQKAQELYFLPRQNVEEDLKGVSALMKAIPTGAAKTRAKTTKSTKKKKTKKTNYKSPARKKVKKK